MAWTAPQARRSHLRHGNQHVFPRRGRPRPVLRPARPRAAAASAACRGRQAMSIEILILGAGAGGGLPQWNCGCANCRAARDGRIPRMTQSSIAVSGNGRDWAVVNASPDIRAQLAATPRLHPTGAARAAVARGAADQRRHRPRGGPADAARAAALHALRHRGDPGGARRQPDLRRARPRRWSSGAPVALETPFDLAPGLTARLFPVPGKVPLYLEGAEVATDLEGEQTVGVELRAGGGARLLPARLRPADAGAGRAPARRAARCSSTARSGRTTRCSGSASGPRPAGAWAICRSPAPDGSMAALAPLGIGRKIYVHLNNIEPRRRSRRAPRRPRGARRRLGDRPRRHGDRAMTADRRRLRGPPAPHRRGALPRQASRSTRCCTAGAARPTRCAPG